MPVPTSDIAHPTAPVDHQALELAEATLPVPSPRAKRRGPLRRLLGWASWALVVLSLVALAVFGLGPQTGAYRTLTVLSGSMVPVFNPGDVIITTKKLPRDVQVGDIIVFNQPVGDHHVTTHRVVKIYQSGELPLVQTKGDANNTADPFKLQIQGNELWYVRTHVPYFGYAIHALRQPVMRYIAFGCIGLLALTFMWQIWTGGSDEDDVDEDGEPLIT